MRLFIDIYEVLSRSRFQLYQIAPDHIFYVEDDEIKDIRELNKARLIIAKQLEEQRLANATVGNRTSFSVKILHSLWRNCPFVWSEFFLFSLSGVLLGIFLKRSWIRLSR
ncbi:unnamed protein product [Haemonchus placei]|uniref:Uncharacterized protein n=1 Tax=Haemonchus placei TaxID=6290 RepID=A0A0N4WD38_HAEPC|nr:unnamed protein product [Haemonchus placei]